MNYILLVIMIACPACLAAPQLEYAVRNGDTVVFLGDSITAARQYSKVIETYTLLRFPERKVRFINAGHGGETAKGSLARLEKDVFGQGATLVTVAYGVNDIGWGTKADQAHKQEYLDAVRELVDRCQKRGVRVFICSAAITAEDPDRAEQGFLQKMCDEGLAVAREKGAGTIDIQRFMRAIQRRVLAANAKQTEKAKHTRMHADDSVHLNDLGQMAMAFAILKGLGAPAEVSAATIDAGTMKLLSSDHCRITDVQRKNEAITFTRTDDRLPLNLAPLWMLHSFYIPIGDEFNRYLLTVTNLASGRYEIVVGGQVLGSWSAESLARGINISSATADPWEPGNLWCAQAYSVKIFTDMRDELAYARRRMVETLTAHPNLGSLRKQAAALEANLVTLQRDMARPVPLHFEIRTQPPNKSKSQP